MFFSVDVQQPCPIRTRPPIIIIKIVTVFDMVKIIFILFAAVALIPLIVPRIPN